MDMLIQIFIAIIVVGLIIWAINTFLPIDPRFKSLIWVIGVVFLLIYLLQFVRHGAHF